MCGLVGIYSSSSNFSEKQLVAANTSIAHRGPDEQGTWVNQTGTCGLGHVRLSIIDLEGGQQPLASPDGSIQIIVNGEFYGFESQRARYIENGYVFQSYSDSEILIPLYLEYGENCLEHLRGEFSFILWDESKQQLFIARDRFGIKPLFFARFNNNFYVASEIKALLTMGVPARWDVETLKNSECSYRNCQDSFFKDVKSVPPGHFMRINAGSISEHKYWDFNYPHQAELPTHYSETDLIDEFWQLLSDSVRLRLRADVPVGVYLSGGIDSSSVLSLMYAQTQKKLHAFTISFDQGYLDEAEIARETARHTGVQHTIVDITPETIAQNYENTVWHNECPFTNNNTVSKYILSNHVRNAGLKVVMTGEGADEVLGGYAHFGSDVRLYNSTSVGPRIARTVRLLKDKLRASSKNKPLQNSDITQALDYVKGRMGFVPTQVKWNLRYGTSFHGLRSENFRQDRNPSLIYKPLLDSLDTSQLSGRDPLNKSLYLNSKSMLPNVILTTLGDRVEMAHSIEARLPFLDHKLVEFLTRLPIALKVKANFRGVTEKYLLKEAARGHVTKTIYHRKKHAFSAPRILGRDNNPMSELVGDTLHGSGLRNLGFYAPDKIINLYQSLQHKPPNAWQIDIQLMHITSLCVMQKKFGLSL